MPLTDVPLGRLGTSGRAWGRMVRVLIVEESVLVARALRRVLSMTFEVVDAVGDVARAVRTLELEHVDVIVADNVDLARIVRVRWPEIVVFMLSGSLDESVIQRAIAEGVTMCFAKPAHGADLVKAIESASENPRAPRAAPRGSSPPPVLGRLVERPPLVRMDRGALLTCVDRLGARVSPEVLQALSAGRAPEDLSDDSLRILVASIEHLLHGHER